MTKLVSMFAAAQLSMAPLAAALAADHSPAAQYDLSFSIRQEERILAKPSMRVRSGEESSMIVEDQAKGEGYRLTALARPVARPAGKNGEWLEISTTYSVRRKGAWMLKMSPVLLVPIAAAGDQPPAISGQTSASLVPASSAPTAADLEKGKGLQLTVAAARATAGDNPGRN